jgi:hypothetical protein
MRRGHPSFFALILLALVCLPSPVRAGDFKPYKGGFDFAATVLDPLPDGDTFVRGLLDGEETSLGHFTGVVEYLVHPDGSFEGTVTKMAANGDLLFESLTGQFNATGSTGTFTLSKGTGRFKNASGGGTFQSKWVVFPFTAVVQFDGKISYNASDRRQ